MAREVIVYTMQYCPFCERAKNLLKQRGIDFKEVRLGDDNDPLWDELYERSKMKTAPQIFAGNELIGGFSDLSELDEKDELKSLK